MPLFGSSPANVRQIRKVLTFAIVREWTQPYIVPASGIGYEESAEATRSAFTVNGDGKTFLVTIVEVPK